MEIEVGSGNVFADLGLPDAGELDIKLRLAVEIVRVIDARRLSQVLLNLVGNVVKFTDAGEVAIGAMAEDGQFVLTVRDTGPGIAPEDQEKIFGEFQQVDNSITKAKGGAGLGLAIVKRIVEMHGGRIWVESRLGHGATFSFLVPTRLEQQATQI